MMKKFAICLLALTGFTFVANSQTRSKFEEEVSVGVQGGLNLSQVRFMHNDVTYANNLGDLGWKKGGAVGASVRFIAQKHFGLQLEADYLQSGWYEKWNDPTTINGVEFEGADLERTINYMSVPLLAHIYFGEKNRLFFNFGPKIGFLLGTKSKNNQLSGEQISALCQNNANDPRINNLVQEKKTDYGLCASAGYELHLSKCSVLAEARWGYGLQDVFEHSRNAVFQRSNNQMFTFTLGVMMPVLKFHSN